MSCWQIGTVDVVLGDIYRDSVFNYRTCSQKHLVTHFDALGITSSAGCIREHKDIISSRQVLFGSLLLHGLSADLDHIIEGHKLYASLLCGIARFLCHIVKVTKDNESLDSFHELLFVFELHLGNLEDLVR